MNVSVLLADDDDLLTDSLRLVLEAHGFRVKAVNDGAAVLEALQFQTFDVIVLDLLMPALNGWGVLRLFGEGRRRKSAWAMRSKLIVLTALNPGPEHAEEMLIADTVLLKPVAAKYLEETILRLASAQEEEEEGPVSESCGE